FAPLNDRKIPYQYTSKPHAHRNRAVPRPAMDVEQNGIPAIRTSDRHPLVDSAYLHLLELLDPTRIHDSASFSDYFRRLGPAKGVPCLRIRRRTRNGKYNEHTDELAGGSDVAGFNAIAHPSTLAHV